MAQQKLVEPDEPYKDQATLKRLYHQEGLTQAEIGHELGVNSSTISTWMDKLNVATGSQEDLPRVHNGDVPCQRCGEPTPGNNLQCGECLDEIRENDRVTENAHTTEVV